MQILILNHFSTINPTELLSFEFYHYTTVRDGHQHFPFDLIFIWMDFLKFNFQDVVWIPYNLQMMNHHYFAQYGIYVYVCSMY